MEEQLSRGGILARSQREDRKGDGMERTVPMEGESFSLIFIFLMGIVLLAWKRLHGLPDQDVLAMFWSYISLEAWGKYRASDQTVFLTSTVLAAVSSLCFLACYVLEVLR